MSEGTRVGLADHLFRRESAAVVASLTRLLGSHNLDLAEDVAQEAFVRAARDWPMRGVPPNPAAWLRRVARNLALDELRRRRRSLRLLEENAALLSSEWTLSATVNEALLEDRAAGDQLRVLYACCIPSLTEDAQATLALQVVGGLSVREVARAYLTAEGTIQKRLHRARLAFREIGRVELPDVADLPARTAAVLRVLYLWFNEAWFATEVDEIVRDDLLEDAVHLCQLVANDAATSTPDAHALLALMVFHAARIDSRVDREGAVVQLPHQDRSRWSHEMITVAGRHLSIALVGPSASRYQLEAGIAGLHATAPRWEDTDWAGIVRLYDRLLQLAPDPVVATNRAIAVAELRGPSAGLAELDRVPGGAESLVTFHAARAAFLRRAGDVEGAAQAFLRAAALATHARERAFLEREAVLSAAGDRSTDAPQR